MRWIAAGIILSACCALSGCAAAMVGVAALDHGGLSAEEPATSEFADSGENYSDSDASDEAEGADTPVDDPEAAGNRPAAHRPVVDNPAANRPETHRPVVHRPTAGVADAVAYAADSNEELPAPLPDAGSPDRPSVTDPDIDRFNRPVADVPLDITPPQGVMPVDQAPEAFANVSGDPRDLDNWPQVVCSYTPWTICFRPLYFEEIGLERYGQSRGCLRQSAISGAHFFSSVALLPYKMTVRRPRSCVCSNGFSRCGDCPLPCYGECVFRWDASLIEAAAVTGFVFILP